MSTDNKIQVEFGADTAGIEAGSAKAAGAVSTALDSMKASFKGIESAVKEMGEQVHSAFEGMHVALGKFNNVMFAVQNAIQGGEMFKEFVKDAISVTKESVVMGRAIGETATTASYLKVALNSVGVSQETYLGAAQKITRTLATNEAAFASLGVATRDSNGNFLSTNTVLQSTNDRLLQFKEGTDRNVEGIKIYGRSWADVAPLVSKFRGETEETRKTAEDLNLVIGVEAVSAMADYNKSQREVNEVIEGIKNTIGQALLPRLTAMANWFASVGPQAVEVTREAMAGYLAIQDAVKESVMVLWTALTDAMKAIVKAINDAIGQGSEGLTAMELFQNVIKVVQIAFIGLRIGIESSVNIIKGALQELATVARMVGGVVGAALHGDARGVADAWVAYKEATKATLQETMDEGLRIAKKGREDIDAAISADLNAKPTVTAIVKKDKDSGLYSDGKNPSTKSTADKSQMSDFKDALRQKLESENAYLGDSTELERKYWIGIAASTKLSVKDRQAVDAEIFNLTKKSLSEQHALQETQIDQEMALGKERVSAKVAEIEAMKAVGKISDIEALTRIKALHEAEYADEVDALNQKLALFGVDAKERQKLNAQLLVAEQKNIATIAKDTAAAAAVVQKSWETAFAPIATSFDTAVKGVIAGTTTIRKAVANMAQSILTEYVNMGVKAATHWAATEAAKTGATASGAATRGAIEAGAAAQSVALNAWAAIKNIMNSAAEAMAGAYKAIVGIPFIGPALAPGVGAGAYATVAAGAASIASASGGYDIPAGVNPITQLHEREMVLPRAQADAVRSMADGGGGGGTAINLTIHATDAASVKRLFEQNGPALAAVLQKQARNFSNSLRAT